ncbi:MAG TPA: phage holin family protein [Burkholderiaceae bacterium]|nr:phage holin family protein [Burkholderiaceae bacterium]
MTQRRASAGLLASLRRLGATTLELARIRLELLGTEIERQKLSILAALIWAALGSVCIALGLVLTSVLIVLLFWDSYRMLAIVGLALIYFVAGALMVRFAISRIQTPSGAFAASREELARDQAALALREADIAPPPTPGR